MRAMQFLILGLWLAACTDFPEIDAANRDLGPAGPAPPLLPFDVLIAETSPVAATATEPDGLDARVAALRTRAAVLRQPLEDPADIDEMRADLARLP